MQSTQGPGNAGHGMDREISAFHPGEKYGRPVGFAEAPKAKAAEPFSPLDGWIEAQYTKPEVGKLVTAWTGRFMCQVVYDHSRGIWVTNKGTPVKVLMWQKSE